jgi:hypothetical protein
MQPVNEDKLEGFDPLNCNLFTVEKLLADGVFYKMKSRFIANGIEQDQDI